MKEQYRFQQGSLYEFDKEAHAYIHCYKRSGCTTKKQAIEEYEEQPEPCEQDELMNSWY